MCTACLGTNLVVQNTTKIADNGRHLCDLFSTRLKLRGHGVTLSDVGTHLGEASTFLFQINCNKQYGNKRLNKN